MLGLVGRDRGDSYYVTCEAQRVFDKLISELSELRVENSEAATD